MFGQPSESLSLDRRSVFLFRVRKGFNTSRSSVFSGDVCGTGMTDDRVGLFLWDK